MDEVLRIGRGSLRIPPLITTMEPGAIMAFWDRLRRIFSTSTPRTGAGRRLDHDCIELVRSRVVPLSGEITDELATTVIATILFLRADSARPLEVRIDSPGGSVAAGLAILDTIIELPDRTHTSCPANAGGVAALLLAAGTRGKRSLGREARVQIGPFDSPRMHEASVLSEVRRMEQTFAQLISRHTGQPMAAVLADLRHGRAFDAEEAIAHGFADLIR